jgi:hypothetical protein
MKEQTKIDTHKILFGLRQAGADTPPAREELRELFADDSEVIRKIDEYEEERGHDSTSPETNVTAKTR